MNKLQENYKKDIIKNKTPLLEYNNKIEINCLKI